MSTHHIVKNHKFELNNIVGGLFVCLCCFCFLEQSMFFIIYLNIRTSKNRANFMEIIRLTYLSNSTRITFLSVMVWEI